MVEKASTNRSGSPGAEVQFGILARINSREQQIEGQLREAREAAAEKLHQARRRERAILSDYKQEADQEADRVSADILAQARRMAAQIEAAGARQAALIRTLPQERIEQTAERLLPLLLPTVAPETPRS